MGAIGNLGFLPAAQKKPVLGGAGFCLFASVVFFLVGCINYNDSDADVIVNTHWTSYTIKTTATGEISKYKVCLGLARVAYIRTADGANAATDEKHKEGYTQLSGTWGVKSDASLTTPEQQATICGYGPTNTDGSFADKSPCKTCDDSKIGTLLTAILALVCSFVSMIFAVLRLMSDAEMKKTVGLATAAVGLIMGLAAMSNWSANCSGMFPENNCDNATGTCVVASEYIYTPGPGMALAITGNIMLLIAVVLHLGVKVEEGVYSAKPVKNESAQAAPAKALDGEPTVQQPDLEVAKPAEEKTAV